MELREQCEVGGLHVGSWLQMYMACNAYVMGGRVMLAWPDGRPLLHQPALTVAMFDVIEEEVAKEQEARDKSAERQRH